MNIFTLAAEKKAEADSKKRAGNTILATTVTLPHFKGVYRRGDEYKVKLHRGEAIVERAVKPLSGAFIISYCTCLASCIVDAENALIKALNDKEKDKKKHTPFHALNAYIVEAVIAAEGFNADEYSQGKIAGAKRIALHLKALAKERKVKVSVNDELVIDIDKAIVQDVLQAI